MYIYTSFFFNYVLNKKYVTQIYLTELNKLNKNIIVVCRFNVNKKKENRIDNA